LTASAEGKAGRAAKGSAGTVVAGGACAEHESLDAIDLLDASPPAMVQFDASGATKPIYPRV
jgi:hypothetical protein